MPQSYTVRLAARFATLTTVPTFSLYSALAGVRGRQALGTPRCRHKGQPARGVRVAWAAVLSIPGPVAAHHHQPMPTRRRAKNRGCPGDEEKCNEDSRVHAVITNRAKWKERTMRYFAVIASPALSSRMSAISDSFLKPPTFLATSLIAGRTSCSLCSPASEELFLMFGGAEGWPWVATWDKITGATGWGWASGA
jgi:hypothetical protein